MDARLEPDLPARRLSRRRVVGAAAWSAPAIVVATAVPAQATMSPGPGTVQLFANTFDNIGAGLPTGVTARTGASAANVGAVAPFVTAATAWAVTDGNFRNVASADGLTSTAAATTQSQSTDRAFGIRQSGSFGDPGAALVIDIGPTTNVGGVTVSFKAQSLDAGSPRTTPWVVDAFVGTTRFTSGTTFTTGGSSFTNTSIAALFGTALDNIASPVLIRIATITASTGSGNRATTGFDDITITGTALS